MQKIIKDVFGDYSKNNAITNSEILDTNLYKKTNRLQMNIKAFSQIILSSIVMTVAIIALRYVMPELGGRIKSVLVLGVFGLISISLYLVVTYKLGTLKMVLGEDFLDSFIKKFKRKEESNKA